jgi:3-hydroxymyristoyl/3-hydroxydecanoyl-(acyl carrier protein) dehydratase
MNIDAAATPKPLDVRDIAAMLPHRYPFLLVDRVIDYTSASACARSRT